MTTKYANARSSTLSSAVQGKAARAATAESSQKHALLTLCHFFIANARGINARTLPGVLLREEFRPAHLLLLGGSRQLAPWASVYAEGRIDLSQNPFGRLNNVLSAIIGLSFNISSWRALAALLQPVDARAASAP